MENNQLMPIVRAPQQPSNTHGFENLVDQTRNASVLQRLIDKLARNLRAEVATELAPPYLRSYEEKIARDLLMHSPFRDHVNTFPTDQPTVTLAFNLRVIQVTIDRVLSGNLSPERQLFLCSRIAELGMYSILNPYALDTPIQFLAVSKQHGYFFTSPEVAYLIADQAIGGRTHIRRVLDPAAGCGALLGAVLLRAKQRKIRIDDIHAIELDPFTESLLKKILRHLQKALLLEPSLTCTNGDAIDLYAQNFLPVAGYDCIVMNPPYGRVKFLRNSLTNAETRVSASCVALEDQEGFWRDRAVEQASIYRRVAGQLGVPSGALDHQRLFIGLVQKLLSSDGRCSFIAPSAWLGDRDGLQIRKHVITSRDLESVRILPEDSGLFATVNQPTAVACLAPNSDRTHFRLSLISGRDMVVEDEYFVEFERFIALDPQLLRIPRVSHAFHDILEQLQGFQRIAAVPWIKNARGELDQTQRKHILSHQPSSLRLVRGDHIERYILHPPESSNLPSYVGEEGFREQFSTSPKLKDIHRSRIAGRQCSYMNKERRLSSVVVPPNVILGNSCNYICIGNAPLPEDEALQALCVILNSTVLEWYFRVYSSNNHVGNYEIDDFPVCIENIELLVALAACGRFLHSAYNRTECGGKVPSPLEDFSDALVAFGYHLDGDQTRRIFDAMGDPRGERVANMVVYLQEHGIPSNILNGDGWHQHIAPSLSALDREIIRHIPQGGNWMDVPTNVPSKRLEQIRKMSEWRGIVRTTYYGRLRPSQPAYTIATYYGRPGNGTNIHPWADRTLTSREAARLQSFPDWYLFLGTDSSVKKQIGNAVPPLLGYAVGRHLSLIKGNGPCIDLFAGAGGLSLGLELAGWKVAAAVEYDSQIAATYCFNRPCEREPNPNSGHTLFLESDLSKRREVTAAIEAVRHKLKGAELGAVFGGPPCQGFSHAGWRMKNDARNDLPIAFLDIVEALRPRLVVLENVEGLLTFEKGRVISDLQEALLDLGYSVGAKPWVLCAEQYGVPQMRRRVFLVGTRGCMPPIPPPPIFERCHGRRESTGVRGLFTPLPYPITAGEALDGLPLLMERRDKGKAEEPRNRGFLLWLRGLLSADDLFTNAARNVAES